MIFNDLKQKSYEEKQNYKQTQILVAIFQQLHKTEVFVTH